MKLLFPELAFPALSKLFLPGSLIIVSALLLVCSAAVGADVEQRKRQIALEGILGSKAVLSIDGKRKLLSKGQQEDGVKIISIHPNSVEVKIEGKSRRLRMGDHNTVASPYKQKESATVIVSSDARGMYTTVGSINGLPVSFLVDTGATSIAMNAVQAKRLGIDFRIVGKETMVGTASGVARAYRVTLDKVTLGAITLRNISAVVLEGGFPVQTLLGMSFLGQLDLQREGSVMRIKKKY